MRGHHGLGPRRDGRPEGHQLTGVQGLEVHVDAGHRVVRVDRGVAVPGEVLGAGGDTGGLEALDVRGRVPGDEAGVGPEGPDADDRVARVGVGVGGRRPVQVDAALGEPAAQLLGDGAGQVHVVDRAEGEVAGERGTLPDLQPGDVTAFLVDRDEDVLALGPQLRGERGDLLGRLDVAAEQGDGGEPFADPAQDPVRGGGAGEPGLQDGERVPRQGVRSGNEGGHEARTIPSRRRK